MPSDSIASDGSSLETYPPVKASQVRRDIDIPRLTPHRFPWALTGTLLAVGLVTVAVWINQAAGLS